jgi:hypothetical protein
MTGICPFLPNPVYAMASIPSSCLELYDPIQEGQPTPPPIFPLPLSIDVAVSADGSAGEVSIHVGEPS